MADPSMGPNMGAITSQLAQVQAGAAAGRPPLGFAFMSEQDMGAGISIQGKTLLPTIQGITLLGSGTNFGGGSIIDKIIQLMKQCNVPISEHGGAIAAGIEAASGGGDGGGGDATGGIEASSVSAPVMSDVSFDDIGPPPPIMNASNSRASDVSSDDVGIG